MCSLGEAGGIYPWQRCGRWGSDHVKCLEKPAGEVAFNTFKQPHIVERTEDADHGSGCFGDKLIQSAYPGLTRSSPSKGYNFSVGLVGDYSRMSGL